MSLSKKTSYLFFITVVLHITASLFISMLLLRGVNISPVTELIFSELLILIPGMAFLTVHREQAGELLRIRRIKVSTIFLTILFTYLLMPLISLVNIISQLFVENEVLGAFSQMTSVNPLILLLLVGIYGPLCEEFVFRGLIFGGYRMTGRILMSAFVSGLLFGLLHLNINQFCYAFLLGVVFALLNEATGSVVSSAISHMIVNSHNVLLLIGSMKMYQMMGLDLDEMMKNEVTFDQKLMMIGVFLVISLITTALATIVFIAICKRENTEEHLKALFTREKISKEEEQSEKQPIASMALYISIATCLFVMFFLEPMIEWFTSNL